MAKVNQSWGGRFSEAPAEVFLAFTNSQGFDRKLYREDVTASCAHAKMLARQGIITVEESEKIIRGLEWILEEIETGVFVWKAELEDVHMNIEARLVEIIGETGKKLHTARSRNDQVGLTFRLYVANACENWSRLLLEMIGALLGKAEQNKNFIMPGCTHFQPAQPISAALHLLAYAGMFRRDWQRIQDALKRIKISPLGACALAGSTFPLDPYFVAKEVNFPAIYHNSMDAVSDRDFAIEAIFCASLVMMHLSRLCEEIIIWANPAFGFIRLPDDFSTGSSIMPQKKNPDAAELIRGKTGRVYGDLLGLLTTLKGLPLTYNSDLQEDKESFFDADKTASDSLNVMIPLFSRLKFNPQAMEKACNNGFINATEIADYLAAKGMPFREAHHIAGKAVAFAESKALRLEDLTLEDFKKLNSLIEDDIFECLKYENCVKRRETPGGAGPNSINAQISEFKAWLTKYAVRNE